MSDIEGYKSHWSCKNCLGMRDDYIQYLQESDTIKKKYLKWKEQEEEGDEEEDEEESEDQED